MDKNIIIDGVDVAGCNFRLERDNKQKCECCHATGFGVICDCENWHNCYYKQLKQAENTVNECHKYLAELEDKIERLEQENKLLTQQLDENCLRVSTLATENIKLEQENKTLQAYKDINEDFKHAWYELNEKYKQLRSALEEIREVIYYCGHKDIVDKVLPRINEVLGC